MQLFDTHAHIGLIHEDPIEQLILIEEAKQAAVVGVLSVSNNLRDFFAIHQNLKQAKNVYYSIGVSPSEVSNPGDDWEAKIEEGADLDRVVAVGEIGLDYYRRYGDRDSQVELFVRQLELAKRLQKPVVIHNRDAGHDVLAILKDRLPSKGGVLHCYSEDYEFAKKALDLNLFISFAGNVTYRNARNLHETSKNIPLDRMLIETEAPFMVPARYRGKRNRPAYLVETASYIAELREVDVAELAAEVYKNSLRFFGIEAGAGT